MLNHSTTLMPVVGIIPPFIIDNIAERGTKKQRRWAARMQKVDFRARAKRSEIMLKWIKQGSDEVYASTGVPPKPVGSTEIVIYDGKHKAELPGMAVRHRDDPEIGDSDADSAYDALMAAYDLMYQEYERNSLDNKGMAIRCTVHHRKKYQNAYWSGKQIVCGDGDGEVFLSFARDISVLAHELWHGVVQFSGGLFYRDQSGALNEHIADVFGAMTAQRQQHQTAHEADWLIGGKIFTPSVQGRALRSMAEPGTAFNDPVIGRDKQLYHMSDYLLTTADYGGVHINSGIPNHAFYQVATLYGGYSWGVPGQIWYNALQHLNDPNTRFSEWAEATIASAYRLFGATSRETRVVKQAWKLVGF